MIADIEIVQARQRVDVIAATVALKRAGRLFCGICCFHNEKTPSFYVYPDGKFHCFGCGSHGDVIGFAMRTRGLDFPAAVRWLLDLPPAPPRALKHVETTTGTPRNESATPQERVDAILKGCGPITDVNCPAGMYLASRGLKRHQPALLAHPALSYTEAADGTPVESSWRRWQSDDGTWFRTKRFPALVAPITNSAGKITAAHRTWCANSIEYDGSDAYRDGRAPIDTRKKGIGVYGDGAVRLAPAGATLGLSEGNETGIAAMMLYRVPVWSCCGTARLGYPGHWCEVVTQGVTPRHWVPPDEAVPRGIQAVWQPERAPTIWVPRETRRLMIFGDRGRTGEIVAAFAAEWWTRHGLPAQAIFPDSGFSDFADVLIGKRSAA